MNIFDDLVNELKNEDLLEETVIADTEKAATPEKKNRNQREADQSGHDKRPAATQTKASADQTATTDLVGRKPSSKEIKTEFFRKRAMEEVSFLQMVEHVLSGVEREQMKRVSKPFDDLKVKKILHEYLQVCKENDLKKQAHYEFQLLQETEAWYTALAERDSHITIGHLRRYCETTKPALSSPALVSLARFYRNSPFSNLVRNKFELIITRVFSKGVGGERRELVFTNDELIEHIKGLYSEWKSIPVYPEKDDDTDILLLAINFQEFIAEADKAESFRDLVNNNFFSRLRSFKKSTNENFFAPRVAAAAVECNILIGNRYVDLIEQERELANLKILDEKNGMIIDQVVTEVTTKTTELVKILEKKRTQPGIQEPEPKEPKEPLFDLSESGLGRSISEGGGLAKLFRINKWLLGLAVLTIAITVGLYVWVEYGTAPAAENVNIEKIDLLGSGLEKYFQAPRLNNGIFYAVVDEKWNELSEAEQEELLIKTMALGETRGFTKVHLFDSQGKTAGVAHLNKISIRKKNK